MQFSSLSAQIIDEKQRIRRVLIVDAYPIVRLGLRRIIDIDLGQVDGIELVRHVRAHHPHLPILVLSSQDETIYAVRMLSVGANGYIMKQATSEQFLASLRRVLEGSIAVSETVGNHMINRYAAGDSYIGRPDRSPEQP